MPLHELTPEPDPRSPEERELCERIARMSDRELLRFLGCDGGQFPPRRTHLTRQDVRRTFRVIQGSRP